ncbi:MAG: multicopper oxidase domain-containing protein [Verrucomicrobia bacterium]|nr:multicopper oxidase domain-containing protein [Verrucomicrobiota bacterium]
MAQIEYWIQIENHPWDACPNGIDRMTGTPLGPTVTKNLKSPATNAVQVDRPVEMFRPLPADALIYRRYKPPVNPANPVDAWTVPDDRKVNPWDINEPDPTDAGTMGTIPGPVIECNVGDSVVVHFRNADTRTQMVMHPAVTHTETQTVWVTKVIKVLVGWIWWPPWPRWLPPFRNRRPLYKDQTILEPETQTVVVVDTPEMPPTEEPMPIEHRLHSMHTHGFVFDARFDGAYPLSPQDTGQAVPPIGTVEGDAWRKVPNFVEGQSKQGDRVPPGGTFTYQWKTIGWPTTSGVWLYHDHSICDMDNVNQGAIGTVVIHNPADVTAQRDVDIRPQQDPITGNALVDPATAKLFPILPGGLPNGSPIDNADPTTPVYRTPKDKALYLQLYHQLTGVQGMSINGRTFLGNTPTLIAGRQTLMRFGIVGMGSDFHTFHIHGHRWLIPGPSSTKPAVTVQNAPLPQNLALTDPDTVLQFGSSPIASLNVSPSAVSQFEDTKIFGPANSFAFTIKEGSSFMRAEPPVGEWHMHCHVLQHMMTGMMGSLLVVDEGSAVPRPLDKDGQPLPLKVINGRPVAELPVGVPCPPEMPGGGGMPPMGGDAPMTAMVKSAGSGSTLHWEDGVSGNGDTTIKVGGTVTWDVTISPPHTIASLGPPSFADVTAAPWQQTFPVAGDYPYQCGIHGGVPNTKTGMWGIIHVKA